KAGLAHAARLGVTSLQDMGSAPEDVRVWSELAAKGELTSRVYSAAPISSVLDQAKVGFPHAFGSHTLRLGALKGYADGSLGSSTAYFFDPYLDAPDTHGLLADDMQPLSKMKERLL